MTTASTAAILDTARTMLLSYTSLTFETIPALLGTTATSGSDGAAFIDRAPSNMPNNAPWMVLSLMNEGNGNADGRSMRRGTIEVMVSSFNPEDAPVVSRIMDLVVEAWRAWQHYSDGTITAGDSNGRITLQDDSADNPGDRNTVAERVLLEYSAAPAYLTRNLHT